MFGGDVRYELAGLSRLTYISKMELCASGISGIMQLERGQGLPEKRFLRVFQFSAGEENMLIVLDDLLREW